MKHGSKKMSGKKLRRIMLPGMSVFLALVVTITTGMLTSAASLDDYFGKGKRTVTTLGGSAGWDTNYYPQLYANKKESRAAATAVSKRLSDEGIVLLKNDGLLPLDPSADVSPFGLRYCIPFYGGSGSSAIDVSEDYIVTPREALRNTFHSVNPTLEEKLDQAVAGQDLKSNSNIVSAIPLHGPDNPEVSILELAPGVYSGSEGSCRGTVGIVFLGRQTGEACDAYSGAYSDGTCHMLALSSAENTAIAFAKANCAAVVVVLESSAPLQIPELQCDAGIGAILWVGGAGSNGYESLADILVGKVVPSGRLPDLWPANFTRDPTFANHDDNTDRFVYNNAFTTLVGNYTWEEQANAPFHEYEEGVYLGYKYYETSSDLSYLENYYNRVDGVLYPFGYGLSYTTFTKEIISFSDFGDSIRLTVRVENTGNEFTGKDVVQVYYTAPYTKFDQDYDIEKPTVVLAVFGKTGPIAPGGHEDVVLSFAKEDMASYCYTRRNADGTTGCYVLEEGEYYISIRANSHDVLDSRVANVPDTTWYDNAEPRQSELDAQSELDSAGRPLGYPAKSAVGDPTPQAATNQFGQLGLYMTDPTVSGATILSRKDWAGTQPTAPIEADRTASDTVMRWLAEADTTKYDYTADPKLGNGPGSLIYWAAAPVTGAKNSIVLADLRGKSYYDPLWKLLLDQIDFSDTEALRLCLFQGAYGTGALDSIGKPESVDHDGPQGLTQPDQMGRNWLEGTCAYPSAPIMAAAWNTDLLYEFGYMVGQEALVVGVNGWYAPGLNLHRSPFGGRVSEYFSEDGVLSGLLSARIISGAGDAGLYCSVKHLALMDGEGHRNPHTSVWLTEQALREVYLKPYELALKNARKTIRYIDDETGALKVRTMRAGDFIMTGDCAVGTYWTSANYELLTKVVRGEWGFQGVIISDININSNPNRVDMLLRAGCDMLMSIPNGQKANAQDYSTPTGLTQLRRAVKNLCYTTVNSNLMQGAAPGSVIHYAISSWKVWLAIGDAASGVLLASLGAWLFLRAQDEKKHPQNYWD